MRILKTMLVLLVTALFVISPSPTAAQDRDQAVAFDGLIGMPVGILDPAIHHASALAIDRSIGVGGTAIGYTGVGFTPGGSVSILLTRGLGLIVDETTANAKGDVSGSFVMPATVPEVGEIGRVDVFAIDEGTGFETLPAFFYLTDALPLDYSLPNGYFFTQANGAPLGTSLSGYAVVNNTPYVVPVRIYDEFLRLGGIAEIGYPVSQPFVSDGFVTQAFQKAVLQWRPEVDAVYFVNVFDELHDWGFDDYLFAHRSTPRQIDSTVFDADKTPMEITRDRLALLDANPAIRDRYFASDDPLLRFGLPTSAVEDFGNHYAVRLQRATIQQWKIDVPWASAGEVVVANGGDIAKEIGLIPAFAVLPQSQPTWSDRITTFDPGKGERVRSGFLLRGDAQVFEATVEYELIGEDGEAIAKGFTTATVGGPEFGRYMINIDFAVASEQPAVLRVFERSAKDGSIVVDTLVSVPLILIP